MTRPLDAILKWAAIATLAIAALAVLDGTPLFGGNWNRGRLLGAGLGGVLGLVLLSLRAQLALAQQVKQELARMPRMQELMEFACHRGEAVRLGQATYVGDDTVLTVLEPAHPIYVDTRCRHVGPHLITSGMWEPQYTGLFRRLLKPGQTVLDIGANHGVYAIQAKLHVGREGQVHAFEPNPRLAALIARSGDANGYETGFAVHACAVGETDGTIELTFSDAGSGGGFTHNGTAPLAADHRRIQVPCVALDTMFADPNFVVHAIKMDIEGAEAFALRGMRRLLARSPDVFLLMEYSPRMLRAAGSSPEEAINLLAGLGFRFWTIRDDGSTEAAEPAALCNTTVALQNLLVSRTERS